MKKYIDFSITSAVPVWLGDQPVECHVLLEPGKLFLEVRSSHLQNYSSEMNKVTIFNYKAQNVLFYVMLCLKKTDFVKKKYEAVLLKMIIKKKIKEMWKHREQ
jgi:hypothetical protein